MINIPPISSVRSAAVLTECLTAFRVLKSTNVIILRSRFCIVFVLGHGVVHEPDDTTRHTHARDTRRIYTLYGYTAMAGVWPGRDFLDEKPAYFSSISTAMFAKNSAQSDHEREITDRVGYCGDVHLNFPFLASGITC